MSAKKWSEVRLGDLVTVKHGWPFKSECFSTILMGRPIVVAIGNFRYTGGFRFETTDTKEYGGDYPREFELVPGDLLVVMTCQTPGGEILGIPARVPNDGRIYLHNQRIGKVVPLKGADVDRRYLYYLFLWAELNQELVASATGTKIVHTAPSRIEAFRFLLPPRREQEAIGAMLGALDDKIELNRRMNLTLEELASALFERSIGAVEDDEQFETPVQGLIDRGLIVVGDGYRAKNVELAEDGLPFARVANINGGFLFEGAELLGWPAVARTGTKVSVPFDVVFTSKGTVGRFAFVAPSTPKFVYSPQLCFWRSTDHESLSPFFLYHWMNSRRFLEQVDTVKGQTDMADYVSLTDQRLMRLTCPPASMHRRFNDEVAPLWALHFANSDESKTLVRLRDTLLPALLSGEVRIKLAEKLVKEVA